MLSNFYFNDGVFKYGFSESHPLKPERLYRMLALLQHYAPDTVTQVDAATRKDLLRVHSPSYLDAVQAIDTAMSELRPHNVEDLRTLHGFWGDNPAFAGMYEAAAAYTGATVAAARAVSAGATLALGIGGGLHHAMPQKASGFCIFNDCAIACSILRDRFERVAYVDIDVHHGDGVQWIYYNDPTVLTCSIHEDGRTLWPGTGGVEETGTAFTSLNVPMAAGTTRDTWLYAFKATIISALQSWRPDAIVLQMGADSHWQDPLAHIDSDQSAWLEAILAIKNLGLPLVALGGGGYNLTTVPRMWTSAILSLADIPFEDKIPEGLVFTVGAKTFSDPSYPFQTGGGRSHAEAVVEHLTHHHLPQLGAGS